MSAQEWIGRTIGGRYQIESLLGQGGMAAVCLAYDPNLNRKVAIKLIHSHLSDNPTFAERFKEEARTVARLRHPNIVQVHDFNNDGGTYYMVLEYLEGETLQAALRRQHAGGRQLPFDDAIRYAVQICEAAGYAHRHDLIHRDIKPANIMLDQQGRATLMDFGIVKIIGGDTHTGTGATIGTATYMSPEQILGDRVDERSDIYSIGITLFEMLSGRAPYKADTVPTLLMLHLNAPIPDLQQMRAGVPAELAAVVIKAMAKDNRDRYQTAAELSDALRLAQQAVPTKDAAGTEISTQPGGAAPRPAIAVTELNTDRKPLADADVPTEVSTAVSQTEVSTQVPAEGPEMPAPEIPGIPAMTVPAARPRLRWPKWAKAALGLGFLAAIAWAAVWLAGQRRPPALELSPIERPQTTITIETQPLLASLGVWQVDASVLGLSFSPDSALLGAATNRNWVRYSPYRHYGSLWSVDTGQLKAHLLGHGLWVDGVAFSPDGALLALAGDEGFLSIWQVGDAALLREIGPESSGFSSAAFSPNGILVATGTWEEAGIWQLSNGNLLRTQVAEDHQLTDIEFSPDGSLLAAATNGGEIFIWQVSDGSLLRRLSGHLEMVNRIAFSPDGSLLASGSDDFNAGLWRVSDGERLAFLTGHTEGVSDVAFSADGQLLASGSRDETIRLWQVSDGALLRILDTDEGVVSMDFSPDGSLLAAAIEDFTVRFWGVSEALAPSP